jgi:hypothetical protein
MVYQREHKSLDGKYTRANYIHRLYGFHCQFSLVASGGMYAQKGSSAM